MRTLGSFTEHWIGVNTRDHITVDAHHTRLVHIFPAADRVIVGTGTMIIKHEAVLNSVLLNLLKCVAVNIHLLLVIENSLNSEVWIQNQCQVAGYNLRCPRTFGEGHNLFKLGEI